MTALKIITSVSLAIAGMFIVGMGNPFGYALFIPMTVLRFTL